MSVQPSVPCDLEIEIVAALSDLEASALEAKTHNDPLQRPFSALASFLRAQRQLYADTIVAIGQTIESARQPVRDEDMRIAVIQGISAHAGAITRSLSWGVRIAAVTCLLLGVGISGGVGYWQGYRSGMVDGSALGLKANATLATLPPTDAATWAQLIRDNLSPAKQLAEACRISGARQDGRLVCDMPVWIEAAKPPTNPGQR